MVALATRSRTVTKNIVAVITWEQLQRDCHREIHRREIHHAIGRSH
jgi:hypothetical protein